MNEDLQDWVGHTETREDVVTAAPAAALAAALDRDSPYPRPGDPVPPLWHWLWFLPHDRASSLAADGHVRRGGFLPPVPLPHRMWAGGRFELHHPLRIGDAVRRTSRVAAVHSKQGRTGPLVFVVVRHEIQNAAGLAIVEEQDLVYRGHPSSAARARKPAAHRAAWTRTIHPGDVLLFRYSALTFNSHRIHYDRRFATEVEGYPGLVVHGPLIATLILELLAEHVPRARAARFEFRAEYPLFDTAPFRVCGAPDESGNAVRLWAEDDGGLALTASASLAPSAGGGGENAS